LRSEQGRLEADAPVILSVDKASVCYDHIQAVWDVSFTVKGGSITALVGSNGAGKTAMLKGIAGILPLSSGTIEFNSRPLGALRPHDRVEAGISLVPEGRRIFPELTVQENLEIGAYTRRARRHLRQTLKEMYQLFSVLETRKRQMAGSLSGGEQQMLAIGRSLMSRPKLLMLDEPFLGLSPLMVKHVIQMIENINAQGVTILLVEQNVLETLRLAGMAYILETGKITLQGTGRALLESPHVKTAYLGL
jgi:branched-chain amino acid transport system ATP-binding protein